MDSTILVFILFVKMLNNKKSESAGLSSISNYLSTMEINPKYTLEKINIVKKIGPYFPENYIPLINKSIIFAERFIKMNELIDSMKNEKDNYIKESIIINNHKDKLNKIITTIQKEAPRTEICNMGTIMDLIINMDKYKTMFTLLSSVINNQDNLKDPTQLINIIAPMMNGNEKKDNDKTKEMAKMMEILKILNTPKKDTPTEEKEIEVMKNPTDKALGIKKN